MNFLEKFLRPQKPSPSQKVEYATEDELRYTLLSQPSDNLAKAKKAGIKPLSLADIMAQVGADKASAMVLFDTSPATLFPNHWRIVAMDQTSHSATLQSCGPFGTYDIYPGSPASHLPQRGLKPYKITMDQPFFTGTSIQDFEHNGVPVTLDQVVSLYYDAPSRNLIFEPSGLVHKGETVLFSNRQGNLRETAPRVSR